MAVVATGLKTAIWNNNLKSVLLLVSYPILILVMVWAFFTFSGTTSLSGPNYVSRDASAISSDAGFRAIMEYGHIVFIAVAIWFVIAWFFHQKMIDASTGAKSLSRREAPEIYNMLENLCIASGMKMPKLQIMETTALNAFASGLKDSNYTVTLTRGIIETLDKQELEAVIAHELSHIKHRDVRLLVISVIFVGMISFIANIAFRSMLWGGSSSRKGQDGRILIIAMIILGIGYFASILVRFALSRRREFMADAGAVEMTKNPDAMIGALQKISGRADMPSVSSDIKQMCIENAAGFMGGIMATHPPIEKRIEALVNLGGHVQDIADSQPQFQSPWQDTKTPFNRRHGPWS